MAMECDKLKNEILIWLSAYCFAAVLIASSNTSYMQTEYFELLLNAKKMCSSECFVNIPAMRTVRHYWMARVLPWSLLVSYKIKQQNINKKNQGRFPW